MTTALELDLSDLSTYSRVEPLPKWVKELRPHQVVAIKETLDAYDAGADVVFLDAPTGSGKTLIAEMVRRALNVRALYVCSDKSLQSQFERDFPLARKLMGRSNYPTEHGPHDKSADDCTSIVPGEPCNWCEYKSSCPYEIAKTQALGAHLAVLNTSYLLAAANYAGTFRGSELVILDEADTMEDVMLGFTEFQVPSWLRRRLAAVPKKGAHKKTIAEWLDDASDRVAEDVRRSYASLEPKTIRSMQSFIQSAASVAVALRRYIAAGDDDDSTGKWIRVYDGGDDTLHLKPVLVAPFGTSKLWRHSARWLLMSATLVSVDEMVDTLGLPLEHATVTVPMTFPVENRPIVLAPVASMTYKATDQDFEAMAFAIQRACELHPGERVLVHTVSKDRAQRLISAIGQIGGLGGRKIVSYRSARERDVALKRYLDTAGSVLFAQSMTRGIDLPGEACRVQVIAKVPFPSLGDKRTSAWMHLPGGQSWYTVQAVREIVQMTGRAVRSDNDHAVTYIFDAQFSRNLWKPQTRRLFPSWWTEAVDRRRDTREFIQRG